VRPDEETVDAAHHFRAKKKRGLTALFVVLLVITACGGGGEAPPEAGVDAARQGTLTCSQECADRGLCGTSPDRGRVILLNREGPSVTPAEYDLAIPENSTVNILEQRVETVVQVTTSIPTDTTFFNLLVPDRQERGWTAAWCLTQGTP
jgi:hypothetical protein